MASFSAGFVKWAGRLYKAKEFYDEADDIASKKAGLEKLAKASDDKERAKAAKEVLGIDSDFASALDAATTLREDLEAINNAEPEWPDDAEGFAHFMAIEQLIKKHGKGSKEVKKACADYAKHLKAFGDEITEALDEVKDMKKQVPNRKKAAKGLLDVSSQISGALDKALKVPLPSTIQAAVFAASEDAGMLKAQAGNVVKLLDQIEKKIDAAVKEGTELERCNNKWIAWAQKASELDESAIKRNAKAKEPR